MDDETRKKMNVEETFAAIDKIIGRLEKGDGSLEEAFADYEEGMKLVKSCNEKIEMIEKRILVLSGDQAEAHRCGMVGRKEWGCDSGEGVYRWFMQCLKKAQKTLV